MAIVTIIVIVVIVAVVEMVHLRYLSTLLTVNLINSLNFVAMTDIKPVDMHLLLNQPNLCWSAFQIKLNTRSTLTNTTIINTINIIVIIAAIQFVYL